jgi:uncharacterized protein (DUF1919 family)
MTVEELINKLEDLPLHAKVCIKVSDPKYAFSYYVREIEEVYYDTNRLNSEVLITYET